MARTSASIVTRSKAIQPPVYRLKGRHMVIVLATDMNDTLDTDVMGGIPASLLASGYTIASLDQPAHGADATVGVQPLTEWRNRIQGGNTTMFTDFAKRVSRLIDEERVGDVSIVGQSRGGYCACFAAAQDTRIKRLFLTAPVTNLQSLTEFDGYTVNQTTFGLGQFTGALSAKAIKVRIHATDTRVSTSAAQTFATAVGAEFETVAGSGHVPTDTGQAAAWLASLVDP